MALPGLVHYDVSDASSDEETNKSANNSKSGNSPSEDGNEAESKVVDDTLIDSSYEESMDADEDGDNDYSIPDELMQEISDDISNSESKEPAPKRVMKRYSCESALKFAQKLQEMNDADIEIPPEPEGSCPTRLQDKICRLYEKKIRGGENLNMAIQSRKDFRNPSIYDKFLVFLGIEERGTNFPKRDFDPEYWRKQPSYEDLARTQREELAKKEKEKKTKVEFVTGTVKRPTSKPSSRPGSVEPAKRTKWDKPIVETISASAKTSLSTTTSSKPRSVSPADVLITLKTTIPAVGQLTKDHSRKHT